MSDIIYREAKEKDLPIVAEYYKELLKIYKTLGYHANLPENAAELWVDSFKRTLGRFSQLFIAESESEILGFALARLKNLPKYQGGSLAVDYADLYIVNRARHQGIALNLCHIVIDWSRKMGAKSIEGQVLINNEPSHQMLYGLGFKDEITQVRLEL